MKSESFITLLISLWEENELNQKNTVKFIILFFYCDIELLPFLFISKVGSGPFLVIGSGAVSDRKGKWPKKESQKVQNDFIVTEPFSIGIGFLIIFPFFHQQGSGKISFTATSIGNVHIVPLMLPSSANRFNGLGRTKWVFYSTISLH